MGEGLKRAVAAAKKTRKGCPWVVDCLTAKRDPKCRVCAKRQAKRAQGAG